MHRCLDRIVLAMACALATGGWVCASNVANRCPGALTCDIDTATVCCPYGSSEWCDGCASSCTGHGYLCNDEAHILDCSFNATIDSAVCGAPVSTPQGVEYTLTYTGTLSGCGQETVLFSSSPQPATQDDIDCGSWDDAMYGGCVSPSSDTTTTHWTFTQQIGGGTGMAPVPTGLTLNRAHGTAPALASMGVSCGPS